jgi:radical SAM protein with 4Fe4S-binding SPASM domain
MNHIAVICSLLHEAADSNSATRQFRKQPVLNWTLTRLARASLLDSVTILCWEDQLGAIAPVAEGHGITTECKGARRDVPSVQAITAARRWSEGWRGGLLGTCEFDLGFHVDWIAEIARSKDADAVILIDPAAGLIDPVLIDGLIQHAEAEPTAELCFSQAAPGLTGTLLRGELLDRLAIAKIHPGRFLTYWPDQHGLDPTGKQGCAPVPLAVARSIHRFKLDSHRQLSRLSRATISLNGQLISSEAEELAHRMNSCDSSDILPRDIVLEINTARSTRPIFSPSRHMKIERPELSVETAKQLFTELNPLDDIRLTLSGVGDPLLSPIVFDIISAARAAGISSINLETDLLTTEPAIMARLADCGVDVVSVHIPAANSKTYATVMDFDGFSRVMENIRLLEQDANRLARGTPLIVPIFTKMPENLADMDVWYDYWIRRLGHAVIVGPSDFAGQIPDTAVADMAPPKRKPCGRLLSRMTILSNGKVVSCEQDILSKQLMGTVGETPIQEIWQNRFGALRACHAKSEWATNPLCAACREWHRP